MIRILNHSGCGSRNLVRFLIIEQEFVTTETHIYRINIDVLFVVGNLLNFFENFK